jgi:membrane protease YdiL (CAAX protease family)
MNLRRCQPVARVVTARATFVNDFDLNGDNKIDEPEISADPHAEFVSAAPVPVLPPDVKPPAEIQMFRWRDLAYVTVFYLVVGAALAKMALAGAAVISHTSEDALKDMPAMYVAAVATSQALLSLSTLAFLWLLVRSRGTAPFWPSLGWRALPAVMPRAALAIRCVLGGAVLAMVIQGASYFGGTKSSVPMEDFFRDRASVLMMMGLGILVAPLIEETLFRGCVYPVVARSFGMPVGIVVTGTLFGLAHSLQLAGAWREVALVTVVGFVLTYVRARTGTVLASFLVHLGYNSFLFGAFFVATGGLRNFPGS